MAAGQGFKTFTTGEVLTAGDVNGYLMQGVLVFASAAARNAAITSPQEGQFAFTKDTNGLWYYDGAAWVASGATGDIEGVTAGVGITGGGTSGTVTITNDMATTITASGDIVVGTGSGTYDNLPIGTTGQLLTADTTVSPYKVKWATPAAASSGLTYITKQTAADVANLTFDSVFTSTYQNYLIVYDGVRSTSSALTADLYFQFRYAGPTTQAATYQYGLTGTASNSSAINVGATGQSQAILSQFMGNSGSRSQGQLFLTGVGDGASGWPFGTGQNADTYGEQFISYGFGQYTSRAYTGFIITASSGNFNGTFTLYGLAKS
jgi:hypothetical protein